MWKVGDWRVDKRGDLHECEEPCPDNGGECCWRQDGYQIEPVPEIDGGGWHWRKITLTDRHGYRIASSDLDRIVRDTRISAAAREYVEAWRAAIEGTLNPDRIDAADVLHRVLVAAVEAEP